MVILLCIIEKEVSTDLHSDGYFKVEKCRCASSLAYFSLQIFIAAAECNEFIT